MEKNSLQKKHVKHNLNENISGEPVCVREKKKGQRCVMSSVVLFFFSLLISARVLHCAI
jgi:hypothetical protein